MAAPRRHAGPGVAALLRATVALLATSPQLGQATCPLGMFGTGDDCAPCPAGTFSGQESATVCERCATGRFSAGTGATLCLWCAAGSFASTNGSSACDSCPLGRVAHTAGASSCAPCPIGHYQDAEGQDTCARCPRGRVSSLGAESADECILDEVSGVQRVQVWPSGVAISSITAVMKVASWWA
uniref:Tyrosine-protein kinase ephrin type A/B receptor-like domain-containing protein n=1 Tax=Zooxanthella nutricula TaxID=1333877 RepID=A0A7S2KFE2_9DINO|mmetsp:Transcript_47414/g.144285  ORF Transcript_47414/g.144285 Transcript_47414/m.144285 type:complete len:184 (+) Transcript_47414:38-589(+)